MILFLTTADIEALAAERARSLLPPDFPPLVCANPISIEDPRAFLDALRPSPSDDRAPGREVVIVRLLGGRRAWPDGFDALRSLCAARSIPLLAFGGEARPDAELTAASTAPPGLVADAFEYLRQGGVANLANLFRFLADTLLQEGFGFDPPVDVPEAGFYRPTAPPPSAPGPRAQPPAEGEARDDAGQRTPLPRIGVIFYRAHYLSGNTEFVDVLAEAIEQAGGVPLPVFCYSLRADEAGRVAGLELLRGRVDALIVTVLAAGSMAEDGLFADWHAPQLEELDVPIIQGLCVTASRSDWERSEAGLGPLDVAMQVALPEFDGRIIGVPFSFKERLSESSPAAVYRADPERARRLARLAVRLARLRRTPNAQKRVAILLSNYPSTHARIGNAVGLDTPTSAVRLLAALQDRGYDLGAAPRPGLGGAPAVPHEGDALIHALIAAGGHDREFLTADQLHQAQARLDAAQYAEWFAALPGQLQERVRAHWGDPPGRLFVSGPAPEAGGAAIVLAGLRFGNVFVGIQPPRGFGENPIAIYHDPDLPPSHHYLAAYWWLDRVFQADAVVHLGKHGTLEWLPGKSLGLSAACAPDAALGDLPLFYPFIVNDPGEGAQAKRRAHAVIVDHLVPPLMRAETYDDLAKLEQLLDQYAQVQSLDPAKLPLIRAQIWSLVRANELHRDLGVEQEPDEFDDFLRHLDGYLCEVKDLRIKDGLHVLGQPPEGEQRLGLLAALLRLGPGHLPGLRRAVAAAYGLDEAQLLADLGAPAPPTPALAARFPGPAARAGEVIDRLEEAAQALLRAMEAIGWDPAAADRVVEEVLGPGNAADRRAVVGVLEFAARDVVPRLAACAGEIEQLLRGLGGRFVPAGPSGSPSRGALNVLPTGRNFYSVDPKALPSRLAWETGQRLADDLLQRYRRDQGAYPEAVGIVLWGTSAMRTQGDDVAEVLALLGVRPVWEDASLRVTGLEVLPLAELGRPRIDVTVRISGFFRDAFPNLIALMDEAVTLVAHLDEPDAENFVAKHARAEREAGLDPRSATIRIFGSKPGAYGAGLLPLIDARNWRTDADLARVYEVWGGYAYGKGLAGEFVPETMRRNFRRIRLAVKNLDNREHDLLDSDDYFQYHGGMVAMVRALTGANPQAYIADSSDPGAVRTRGLAEETRRVVRARVINPRWIASMMRHGYKGAFELAATVDYLFGYDATTGAVDDWMYGAVAERYALDPAVADFMRQSNPWALRAIAERLLEAAERGLWADADPEVLARLRRTYLELDAQLEPDGPAAPR